MPAQRAGGMGDKVKILAFGDVNGNFEKLFTNVERLNERAGPFEACLCAMLSFRELRKHFLIF